MPQPDRWFEDLRQGEVAEFGDHLMTEAEILEFARRFDPQPFHVDAGAARESIYGGLIASGWHTGSAMMRMLVDHWLPRSSMGSPGLEQVRWLRPVRPGDRLSVRVTIRETRLSQSRPGLGIATYLTEVLNQDRETVMSLLGTGLFRCRPA
ncbi:MAG TPA: MaoC family dehydratase [Acetobacteraceae bacterium]|nr:MaoC family dehydratase [Acetobacteraceae bacterium]